MKIKTETQGTADAGFLCRKETVEVIQHQDMDR